MKKHQIYIFIGKRDGFPKVFTAAVAQESQAKHLINSCANASVKIEYAPLSLKDEDNPDKRNGLYVLLEDRMMNGKFYPTGTVFQNEEETQQWLIESPVGVERKFEEVEITRPHKVLKTILQNS
ncbi:MAG: hypothetical protein WCO66_04310 [Candidatus Absconditabacteria bacterium]